VCYNGFSYQPSASYLHQVGISRKATLKRSRHNLIKFKHDGSYQLQSVNDETIDFSELNVNSETGKAGVVGSFETCGSV
jgi:hypothetical protein